jgi:hypothetical protein
MTVTELREWLEGVERQGLGGIDVTYDGGYGRLDEYERPAIAKSPHDGSPIVVLNKPAEEA